MIYPICKGCGQMIQGRYLTALGATWHPNHFMCAACGQPIGGASFHQHEGRPYHLECHARLFAPRCAYCGKPLTSEYLIDHWGQSYCKEHQGQYPSCAYCGRLVPPHQNEPSPDGAIRCAICRASAIETVEEARPLFSQVKHWISSQGLVYNNLPLSLDLCGPQRLSDLLRDRSLTHARGATVSSSYIQNGQVVSSEVKGVAVLRGLPATLFQGVTTHELGHVWLVVHGVQQLPPWGAEGFCELLSYRLYNALNTPESLYYARGIERNLDPIYGEGFRRVHAIAERQGFTRLLETLSTTRRLPV